MDISDLQAVQYAMEILDRHYRKRQDVPKAPRPEPHDNLLGPGGVEVREPYDMQVPHGPRKSNPAHTAGKMLSHVWARHAVGEAICDYLTPG
jgi:hypothetical protein